MEELLRLGVLGDVDFVRLLRCIVDTKTPTCDVCEVVRSAVEAREGTSSPAANNPLLTRLYLDILNQWLGPPLLEIILRYSTDSSRVSSISSDIDISQKTSGVKSECVMLDCSASKECFSLLPQESVAQSKYEETNLITKLCDLVAVISKAVCGVPVATSHLVPEFGDSLRQGNSEVQETFKLVERIFEAIAAAFRVQLQDVLCEERSHRVKLLSLAFSTLLWDGCCGEVGGFQCAARQVVEAALCGVEVWHDPDITASLFTLVIVPFVEASTGDRSEVIQKVWSLLYSLYSVGEDGMVVERSSVGLVVLCFLSDLMSDGEIFKWINMDEKFWVIVQYSLVHSDPFSRKRGRHVLRKCVDQYSSWKCSSQYLPQLEGQKEFVMQLWNDFFLLLETLEEKQIHVVKPVLEKLDVLISNVKKEVMHPSWAVVVLQRLLGQEGRTIRVWGAGKVLGLRLPHQVLERGVLPFITHHLLPALADYSLYSREPDQQRGEPSGIGSQIPPFLSSVVGALDNACQQRFMVLLLEKLFDGQPWGGIPLFYLVRSLALLPPIPAWNFLQSKEAAVNLEACLSTQEIGLRSASQCDFLRALLKHSCPNTTFLELCHLVCLLRRQECWRRGTTTWQAILEGVKDRPESRQARLRALQQAIAGQLTTDSSCGVPPHDVALGLCLAVEEGGDGIGEALVPLTQFLEDCHLRPYLDPHGREWVVQLLTHMLQILGDSVPGTPSCQEQPLAGLSDGLDCLLQLFVSQLSSFSQPDHLEDLQLYLELLKHCTGLHWSQTVAWRHYPEVMEGCHSLLVQQQPVPASLGVVVLEHLLEYYFPAAPPHHQSEAAVLFTLYPRALTQTRLLPGHELSTATSTLLLVTPCSSWHCVELLLMAKVVITCLE